ncbi:MAG: ASKHA domain-containing protein, partial [Candidatus Adiutrix sp.]|nr:ASKHA domain-containing protein [Candidatus Adiutrix sp.]
MAHKISIPATGQVVEAEAGNLREALARAGIFLESPCGGAGKCGKCLVEIPDGPVPPPRAEETAVLSAEELARPGRLACLLELSGDLKINLPQVQKEARILSSGLARATVFEPSLVKQVRPRLGSRATYDSRSAERLWAELTGVEAPPDDLNLRLALAELLQDEVAEVCTLVWDGPRPRAIEAGDTSAALYGLAVDIGTTTIVAALVDLTDGRELGSRSLINPQTRQGLDVISRITYCADRGSAGVSELRAALWAALNELALGLARDHGLEPRFIYLVAVAANTTMLHLLTGISPVSLGSAPFAPVFTRSLGLPAAAFGPGPLAGAELVTLPSVSAYIGADIVAGAFVCDLEHQNKVLFIDIGTNGEIVLAANGRLLACSCAAGPALEGMNIQYGMRAATGAVEEVRLNWSPGSTGCEVELSVIGGVEPAGLCGSGILAAIREFLRVGLIRRDGRLLPAEDLPAGDPRRALCRLRDDRAALGFTAADLGPTAADLCITQKDIRQVQLAKGAILSAFRALLARTGLEMADLDRILVAGQFGRYLSPESLTGCGILPPEVADRIEYVGNTSKVGAYLALTSRSARRAMEEL